VVAVSLERSVVPKNINMAINADVKIVFILYGLKADNLLFSQ